MKYTCKTALQQSLRWLFDSAILQLCSDYAWLMVGVTIQLMVRITSQLTLEQARRKHPLLVQQQELEWCTGMVELRVYGEGIWAIGEEYDEEERCSGCDWGELGVMRVYVIYCEVGVMYTIEG